MPSVSRSRTRNRSLSRRSWRERFLMLLGTLQIKPFLFLMPFCFDSTYFGEHQLSTLFTLSRLSTAHGFVFLVFAVCDVQTCSAGDIFGELALLYNCPRAACNSAPAAPGSPWPHGTHFIQGHGDLQGERLFGRWWLYIIVGSKQTLATFNDFNESFYKFILCDSDVFIC